LTAELKIVTMRLDRHGGDDGLFQPFAVAGMGAQDMAQVHGMLLS
jgi:hypothetical protein